MNWLFSIGLHNAAVAMLLTLLVWGVTRIWKNRPLAHLMWLVVLVKLVTPPVVNFGMVSWPTAQPESVANNYTDNLSSATSPSSDGAPQAPLRVPPSQVGSDSDFSRMAGSSPNFIDGSVSRPATPARPAITVATVWSAVHPVLMWIWLAGAGLMAIFAAIRIFRFRRILAGTLPASQRLQAVADELATRMGLRKSPDVRLVDSAAAPLVWCLGGRATVLLPMHLLGPLDEQQTAMVLAHELAHLCRRDHWVRVIELVVSVLYWWNPLVWWIRRRLHAVEEQCCDAWVAWVYPDRSHEYANSLLKAAELSTSRASRLVLASPFLNTLTLKTRIEMVLKNNGQRLASRRAVLCVAVVAAVVIPAGVRGTSEARALRASAQADATAPKEQTQAAASIPKGQNGDEKPAERGAQAAAAPIQNAVDEKPIANEFLPFQGSWNFESYGSLKWPAELDEFQTWQWTIQGSEITWTRPGQETVKLSFAVDPGFTRDPKKWPNNVEFTFLNGPDQGAKCLGIFYWFADTEILWVCFQDPGANGDRPRKMGFNGFDRNTVLAIKPASAGAGSKDRAQRTLARPPVKIEKPITSELQVFQGTWGFGACESELWYTKLDVIQKTWKWAIQGQEITWVRSGQQTVRISFTIDPTKTPNQIDFTFLDGPDQGKTCQGIYEFERSGIWVCLTEPGAQVGRPTKMAMSGASKTALLILHKQLAVGAAKPGAAPGVPAPTEVTAAPIVDSPPVAAKAEDRGPEIDAAIARLRELGAFVREFHPRGDPQYWVQIISTGSGRETRASALNFSDMALRDVEIIARGVPLQLHLRHTSVTPAGLVQLATSGRIDLLELTGDNVEDAMLQILPKLPLAGELGLSSNRLTNAGLEPVSACRQLGSVNLEGAFLSDACLEHLTNLPKLYGVALGRTFTRDAFDILGRLPGLTNLDVAAMSADLLDFAKVPKLRRLHLRGREYNDEAAQTIADTFKSLEQAYLRSTTITNAGVEHLSRLETLKILTLDDSLIDDGVANSIRKMKQLTWLSVGNFAVGDDTLAAVSECPEMWYLSLARTQVTDDGLAHLTKLKKPLYLYLESCKLVTDGAVKTLSQLPDSPNLHLNLQITGITENGARELQAALPKAQITWGVPPVKLK